jgi:hypothetical protein
MEYTTTEHFQHIKNNIMEYTTTEHFQHIKKGLSLQCYLWTMPTSK